MKLDVMIQMINDLRIGAISDDTDPANILVESYVTPFDLLGFADSIQTSSDAGVGTTRVWSDGSTITKTDSNGDSYDAPACGWAWGSGGRWQTYRTSLSFDGVDDYISLSSASVTSFFTVECWLKNNQTIKDIMFLSGVSPTYFKCNAQLFMSISVGGAQKTLNGSTTIPQDTWNHVAFTYDGSSMCIYLNGVLDSSRSQTGILDSFNFLRMGRWIDADQRSLSGALDEVRLWTVARTQAEIATNMNGQLVGNEVGLVGYWPLDQVNGTTTPDGVVDRYTNILGSDGSCESLAPFTLVGATPPALSSTQVKGDSNSIKISPVATNSYVFKDYTYQLDATKNYILAGWVYVESYTSGGLNIRLWDVGGFVSSRYGMTISTAIIGSWQFYYAKIPVANTLVGTGFRLQAGNNGTSTLVAYLDSIRLYELSATDYAAIGTTYTNATSPSIDDFIRYGPRTANDGTLNNGPTLAFDLV
jgi:hypothetical protein